MVFYYALRTLANYINGVRQDVFSMAVAIRNIWLIGDNLYTWFASISARLGVTVSYVYQLADSWLQVYNDLRGDLQSIPGLSTLIYYLDDLLSLVKDFAYAVGQAIRNRFPALYNFNFDPVSYILEVMYRYTGLGYSFIHNPTATITSIVNVALGDLRNLLINPYAYIVNKLTLGNPLLQLLLLQPSIWLRREINILFPQWELFINNPSDYVVDAFVLGIERLGDRYGLRLAKVAEKIISIIF